MYNTRAIRLLTFMSILGASVWMLVISPDGLFTGVAIWLLFAVLCALMTVCSLRTRWYVRGLVGPRQWESK